MQPAMSLQIEARLATAEIEYLCLHIVPSRTGSNIHPKHRSARDVVRFDCGADFASLETASSRHKTGRELAEGVIFVNLLSWDA